MNKTRLTIIVLLLAQICISQVFDSEIEKVVQQISTQLNKSTSNLNIAIYPFKYKRKNEDVLAEYITDEFWDKMPNMSNSFSVMDRSTFDEYFQEHILKTEGLIDPSTEKQFGMLIAADAYVTGKTYVFNSVINLKIKVTNTETGEILATGSGKLPITYDMAEYMGLKGWEKVKKESEKGKSNNPNCATRNIGDICFENNSNKIFYVRINDIGTLSTIYRNITVKPSEFSCFKDLPEKSFHYSVSEDAYSTGGIQMSTGRNGNFYIKKCQSSVIKL